MAEKEAVASFERRHGVGAGGLLNLWGEIITNLRHQTGSDERRWPRARCSHHCGNALESCAAPLVAECTSILIRNAGHGACSER
jgi:hypothetical protein